MNVSLTPQLEKLIHKEIKSGRYSSASEVVRDALRLFNDRKKDRERKLEELRRELQIGIDQLDRGESRTIHGEKGLTSFMEEIKQRGRRRLASKLKNAMKRNGRR